MKTRTVISLVIIGLLPIGSAYALTNALTNAQITQLAEIAHNTNAKDLAKLENEADYGDKTAIEGLMNYWVQKKDHAKELYWFKKFVKFGTTAKYESHLGIINTQLKDYNQAFYWFNKAIADGDNNAELNMGVAYVDENHCLQGVNILKKFADQGDPQAEYIFGSMHNNSTCVPKNRKTAIMWWKKAAAQGGEFGELAQHKLNIVDREINSETDQHLSLIDLVNGSPYANKGKKYHIYFSKVVQLISEHDDLLDYKGNYYIAKFKVYAPQKGNFITGYCSGLGAIRYQSADNRLEIVPHVFFYRFKAYSLDNLKYAAMAENLEMQQMMAIGMQAFGGKTD